MRAIGEKESFAWEGEMSLRDGSTDIVLCCAVLNECVGRKSAHIASEAGQKTKVKLVSVNPLTDLTERARTPVLHRFGPEQPYLGL